MNDINRVLIVGGGIAGLTAATALAHQGVSCEIVELNDSPAGAGITLMSRAIDGLLELGVLDRCVENGIVRSPQEVWSYYDGAGTALPMPTMPSGPPTDLPRGIFIHRPTFAGILSDAASAAGVTTRFGVGIAKLTEVADGVTATLTDGSEETYDLVIGADGVRSKTRELIFGDKVTPTYSGTTMFRYLFDDVPDVGPEGFYQHEGVLHVIFRLLDGRLYLATGRNYPEKPKLSRDDARATVRELLSGFTAPLIVELHKRVSDEAKIIVNDYDWVITPDPWYRGSVLLIGDAAHSTTAHLGYGGGMAIEDSAVLGQEVAVGGTREEVLERFMKRRFERARLVVESSVKVGEMLQNGGSVEGQNALRGMVMGVLASPY